MEQVKKSRRPIRPCTRRRDLTRDVPEELIQYIQSLLPVKQAARTSVLSKSWLHAWSTIPTLRFLHQSQLTEPKYKKLINRTLRRYHRDNIPIVSFNLHFDVHDQKAVFLTDKWVRKVASKSCLKELYLTLAVAYKYSYTLPDEIFSSENLHTISAKHVFSHVTREGFRMGSLWTSRNINVVISCVNLRVLELFKVHISEEVLHKLFSTCTLLEKINLTFRNKYKTLKVKNLCYLHELKITPYAGRGILEISDVPSLRLFSFDSSNIMSRKRLWLTKDSLGSLRELFLAGVVIDNEFLDIFKSNFPFLEILSLDIERCMPKILDITCASLKRLVTQFQENMQIDIQVCAPRLVFFSYTGEAMPGLSFPMTVPDQIVLELQLMDPVDYSFFLKIRETLNLSSNFEIMIDSYKSFFTMPFNIDDVRTRVMSPATNVQKLSFDTEIFFDPSPLLDALFSICHPKYVEADGPEMIPIVSHYLRKLIASRMVEKKTQKDYWPDLKDVEVEDCGTLTSSWTSLIHGPIRSNCYYSSLFRLTWRSP